jgi:hypothetical protein
MFMITRTRRGWLALVTLLALALAPACSAGDPDRADTVSVSTNDDQTEAATEGTVEQVEEQVPEEGGEVEQPDTEASQPAGEPPTEPLATVEGQPPFSSLEVTDLRRVGDTVTLEFVIVGAESARIEIVLDTFAAPQDRWDGGEQPTDERRSSMSGVTLVDQDNRKRHLVLRDSEGACLCTSFGEAVSAAARFPHSAQFPAPPDDVTQMTVQVPSFPAIDNVPVRMAN